jgi:Fe-S-cluster-containing hydrogenase component 2
MSEILRQKGARSDVGTSRHYRGEIAEIDFGTEGKAPTVKLKDGQSGLGACLGCADTPCMKKSPIENQLPAAFKSFPGDPSQEVCPTQALRWNETSKVIEVSSDCIGCGLCAVRCPYGAIYLKDGATATVTKPEASQLIGGKDQKSDAGHPISKRKGRLGKSNAVALRNADHTVIALPDTRAMQFVRNILHELRVQCGVRRKGDTNIRLDAIVAFQDGKVGVAEVEFSGAVLESPRALLEDIAVLHGRYAMPVDNIVPISIILSLPNVRSEYYKVIEDIHRVLHIRCHTLTVGALLLLLWNFGHLQSLSADLFTTAEEGADLSASVVKTLGNAAAIAGEPYLGALRTAK